MKTPTIQEVINHYPTIAAVERMKTGRPGPDSVANAVYALNRVCEAGGLSLKDSVGCLTRRAVDTALCNFVKRDLSRVTAQSYLQQARCVFAKWAIAYYTDAGWNIPSLDFPVFVARKPRYSRPSAEMLMKVKDWYGRLKQEYWFAATMLLEFAVRNGDILRLRPENFVTDASPSRTEQESPEPRHYLFYTPHKTALSSGRTVCWPIHESIWKAYCDYGCIECIDVTVETFTEINEDLRLMGFRGPKASYELRKICIDHVYQCFGAEAASSISGDDIRTITRFYADPAKPNIGATRIIDLL